MAYLFHYAFEVVGESEITFGQCFCPCPKSSPLQLSDVDYQRKKLE